MESGDTRMNPFAVTTVNPRKELQHTEENSQAYTGQKHDITRCVCETRMPPKRPFFEKCNLYI